QILNAHLATVLARRARAASSPALARCSRVWRGVACFRGPAKTWGIRPPQGGRESMAPATAAPTRQALQMLLAIGAPTAVWPPLPTWNPHPEFLKLNPLRPPEAEPWKGATSCGGKA